jgi:hypothetical protein
MNWIGFIASNAMIKALWFIRGINRNKNIRKKIVEINELGGFLLGGAKNP